jgi:hypothetical protein
MPVQEFHPVTASLAEDVTEVTCEVCGPLGVAAADHVIMTGHAVLERRVRVTVVRERQ